MAEEEKDDLVLAEDAADDIADLAFEASDGDVDEAAFLLCLSAVRLVIHKGEARAIQAVQRVQSILTDLLTMIDEEGFVVDEDEDGDDGPAALDPGDPP